ncbi:MAG: cyclase family protein [Lachnospiraceae bacterium]|nr:cyclase family protein [Robinsoniella sp.]MDY3766819.1 cyclase family protein [Lachnospiraceae bacterium]
MKIYDISQEIFHSKVFPGDPIPKKDAVLSLEQGDPCNLTHLELGSHTGSHMDAPSHFLAGAKTIDTIDLEKCVGLCRVITMEGTVDASDIRFALSDGIKRLLIRGEITISQEAAQEMTSVPIDLIGVEGLTVGPLESPRDVHVALLEKEIVILEGLVLSKVPDGLYWLVAQPLKLGGIDGSPVRPLLLEYER